jgi:hypothetical protein
MKAFLEKIIAVFFLFFIAFVPLNFEGKNFQFEISNFMFHNAIRFLERHFFKNAIANIDFSSDSVSLNLLFATLFFIAIICVFILSFFKINIAKIIPFSRICVVYYLAFILLKYGFDKIFKAQFYLPEPNILYSQFGNLSPDILYWSTMGTSRFYSVSLGIIEVFVAFLILSNRTRAFGLLLSIAVFVNIILVNFGFDISVKTFSMFLLLASIFAIYPNLKSIFNFFIYGETVALNKKKVLMDSSLQKALKFFVVGTLLILVLHPYFESKNFNDDKQKRPFLHGVYQVNQIIRKKDTLQKCDFFITKIFIHRKNYIIFESPNNEMKDYHFEYSKNRNQLILENYHNKKTIISYEYSKKDSVLTFQFKNYSVICKVLNWRKLNAIQNKNHFTIDEIK